MTDLKFAIIGAGNIGRVHAQAVSKIPGTQVTVVCNRGEARGRALAERHGAAWLPDYREAVRRADVDVVCICTPSGTHADIAEAAAAAGKHLAVEKPLDVTLERADRIIRAVDAAGVKLTGIFHMRFNNDMQAVKQALAGGKLGRLVLADAYVKWHRSAAYYEEGWRGTLDLDGGGALINQSIHTIDLLQWLAGPVKSIFARTATLVHPIEGEDTASAVLEFESGALGVIQGATSTWPGDPSRLELHGNQGTIVMEEGRIVTWQLADDDAAYQPGPGEDHGSGAADPMGIDDELHRRQLVDLVDAIQQNRPPAIAGREARKALEIVQAIYQSARTGELVRLPL